MFEQKYFVQSKISNYEDYRKRRFGKLADDLITLLKLKPSHRILDFGTATGGLLKALKDRGLTKIKGTDISYWAIEYGQKHFGLKENLEYHNINLLTEDFDIIFFLDVLEHVPTVNEIRRFLKLANCKSVVVRVPVSIREGDPYFFDVSRNDVTHVQCHTKKWWINLFEECGYKLNCFLHGKTIYDSEGVFAGVFQKCK